MTLQTIIQADPGAVASVFMRAQEVQLRLRVCAL